ncbi:MAG: type II toxin-antitoxin system VapC family toxin [Defluviitaleaceae bacterium]|nr:type II toxin-antitoxin system VapC family toxin [Defluviitaleaceae bacterium]
MDYLLDTHVLLWIIFDSDKLSPLAQKIILDKNIYKFVSISSLWEISIIKNRIGKLPLPNDLSGVFSEVEMNGFGIIGINQGCLETYNTMPLLHRDPFDGIVIATALLQEMTIITADENIQKYDVPWIW